jgi:hypothetical protein
MRKTDVKMSRMSSKNIVTMKQNFLNEQKQRIDVAQKSMNNKQGSRKDNRGASHNAVVNRNSLQPLSVGSVETMSSNDRPVGNLQSSQKFMQMGQ